jgi:hypothetical protein
LISVGTVYFFDIRPAMYVLSTTITATTIAIKTAAVGQSMTFLRYAIRWRGARRSLRSTLFARTRVEQGRWSHALVSFDSGSTSPPT